MLLDNEIRFKLTACQDMMKCLGELGIKSMVAGGFVRDLEHGINPKDADIFLTTVKGLLNRPISEQLKLWEKAFENRVMRTNTRVRLIELMEKQGYKVVFNKFDAADEYYMFARRFGLKKLCIQKDGFNLDVDLLFIPRHCPEGEKLVTSNLDYILSGINWNICRVGIHYDDKRKEFLRHTTASYDNCMGEKVIRYKLSSPITERDRKHLSRILAKYVKLGYKTDRVY